VVTAETSMFDLQVVDVVTAQTAIFDLQVVDVVTAQTSSQESECQYIICVMGIDLQFWIRFWNCSDSVVFGVFRFNAI
jgi:hypothetical protein